MYSLLEAAPCKARQYRKKHKRFLSVAVSKSIYCQVKIKTTHNGSVSWYMACGIWLSMSLAWEFTRDAVIYQAGGWPVLVDFGIFRSMECTGRAKMMSLPGCLWGQSCNAFAEHVLLLQAVVEPCWKRAIWGHGCCGIQAGSTPVPHRKNSLLITTAGYAKQCLTNGNIKNMIKKAI